MDDGYFGIQAGQFGFNVSGTTGQIIVLEGSSDLQNWKTLSTNVL